MVGIRNNRTQQRRVVDASAVRRVGSRSNHGSVNARWVVNWTQISERNVINERALLQSVVVIKPSGCPCNG